MLSDYPTILLAGRDPDLLLLRSAMLASAGMWSMRVRDAAQAAQVLQFVECDLAILCYTLYENEQQELTNTLLNRHRPLRVLKVVAGDDCCGTGFLHKVEGALHDFAPVSHVMMKPPNTNSRMIR